MEHCGWRECEEERTHCCMSEMRKNHQVFKRSKSSLRSFLPNWKTFPKEFTLADARFEILIMICSYLSRNEEKNIEGSKISSTSKERWLLRKFSSLSPKREWTAKEHIIPNQKLEPSLTWFKRGLKKCDKKVFRRKKRSQCSNLYLNDEWNREWERGKKIKLWPGQVLRSNLPK